MAHQCKLPSGELFLSTSVTSCYNSQCRVLYGLNTNRKLGKLCLRASAKGQQTAVTLPSVQTDKERTLQSINEATVKCCIAQGCNTTRKRGIPCTATCQAMLWHTQVHPIRPYDWAETTRQWKARHGKTRLSKSGDFTCGRRMCRARNKI